MTFSLTTNMPQMPAGELSGILEILLQVAPPSVVRCSRTCKKSFGCAECQKVVTAPTQPIFSLAQPIQRRYGKPVEFGSMNFFWVQVSPPSSVWLTCPLLFTSQPFFSSKNQMSSVREFATGEFVATHFQSFAVAHGHYSCYEFCRCSQLMRLAPRRRVWNSADSGKQRQHRGPDMAQAAGEPIRTGGRAEHVAVDVAMTVEAVAGLEERFHRRIGHLRGAGYHARAWRRPPPRTQVVPIWM